MFSGFFSSQTVTNEVRETLYKNIYQKNTDKVLETLAQYNNLLQKDFIDPLTNDTLLHLAIRTKNIALTKYLLNRDINKEVLNVFNETALDIAIKNQSTELVKIIMRHEQIDLPNNIYKKELDVEKTAHKRKREECELLYIENLDLTRKLTKLEKDNEELKKTVKTLSNSLKK